MGPTAVTQAIVNLLSGSGMLDPYTLAIFIVTFSSSTYKLDILKSWEDIKIKVCQDNVMGSHLDLSACAVLQGD